MNLRIWGKRRVKVKGYAERMIWKNDTYNSIDIIIKPAPSLQIRLSIVVYLTFHLLKNL